MPLLYYSTFAWSISNLIATLCYNLGCLWLLAGITRPEARAYDKRNVYACTVHLLGE